jgi:hypothetical protein
MLGQAGRRVRRRHLTLVAQPQGLGSVGLLVKPSETRQTLRMRNRLRHDINAFLLLDGNLEPIEPRIRSLISAYRLEFD